MGAPTRATLFLQMQIQFQLGNLYENIPNGNVYFTLLLHVFICQLASVAESCERLILTSMLILLPHSPVGTVIKVCGFVWVVWVGGYH